MPTPKRNIFLKRQKAKRLRERRKELPRELKEYTNTALSFRIFCQRATSEAKRLLNKTEPPTKKEINELNSLLRKNDKSFIRVMSVVKNHRASLEKATYYRHESFVKEIGYLCFPLEKLRGKWKIKELGSAFEEYLKWVNKGRTF